MEQSNFFAIISFILRIVGAIVCSNQAKWLNRNSGSWAIIGFFFPIIAMIWIFCLNAKPIKNNNISSRPKSSTKYYTKSGIIEVENEGERKVLINGQLALTGTYELNRIEPIEVIDGKINKLIISNS